jgi:isopenicillin-N N-acyltransferase like protein
MNGKRIWRWVRNIALVFIALLLIGMVWLPQRTRDAEGRWRVGNNWLGRDTFGLYEVYIEGPDLQRGLAYGSLAKELIEKQERIFTDRIRTMVPGERKLGFLKYFVAWFDRDLDEHVPMEYQREIFGVSRSFSDRYDEVGPKFLRALNYHAAHDIGHALQDLAMVGCTSFAAWGDRTADSSLLVGRNFDFWMGDEFAQDKLITFINPEEGIPHVLISWGGFMGAASAMNTDGLTVTINASKSSLPTGARMPISLLARTIVEHASTLDEAVMIAKQHEVFVSESILVSSARDGRAVIIEKAPDGMDVYTPPGDALVCANHYQSPAFDTTSVNRTNLRESDSKARFDRMHQLVDTAQALDVTTAVNILRDREGPGTRPIGLGNPMAINQLIAHHGVVFEPAKKRIWISAWPYQCGAFVCYDLGKVFARCLAKNVHGPMYESELTIPSDPFVNTPAFVAYRAWSDTRVNIATHVLSGEPYELTHEQEMQFIRANPRSYITFAALGDLRRSQNRPASAAIFYRKALEQAVSSEAERNKIQQRLDACTR